MYGGLKSLLRCVDTAFRTILDVVYPPMCASCHRRLTSSEQGVCVFCASKLVPYRSERWHAEERLWSVPAFRNLYSIYVYSKEHTRLQVSRLCLLRSDDGSTCRAYFAFVGRGL